MTGFEYQVAGHMIWEGMAQEGLAVTRAIHDRYHASRRNPWNEVECGDHYARAMAGYGVFLAACGYAYHGPKGYLAFAPRMSPEDFRAAFTTAEGWGTFHQKRDRRSQQETINVRWGRLRVRTLAFTLPEHAKPEKVSVTVAGKVVPSTYAMEGRRVVVTFVLRPWWKQDNSSRSNSPENGSIRGERLDTPNSTDQDHSRRPATEGFRQP